MEEVEQGVTIDPHYAKGHAESYQSHPPPPPSHPPPPGHRPKGQSRYTMDIRITFWLDLIYKLNQLGKFRFTLSEHFV